MTNSSSFNITPKVLIVDDLRDNRLMIKLTLKKAGVYEFFEASNGKEAYDIALKEHPHIVLMDAMMPVMDGFEAIRLIRNNEITKDIPIIMVSSLDNKNEKVKALQSGISDFISKPFDQTELIIRVNSLLHLYIKFIEKQKALIDINADLENQVSLKLEQQINDIKLISIGQMAAGITHELNTPVSFIKSNLELLELDIDDLEGNEKIKNSMQEILITLNDGVNRLRGIIDTTREISKKGENKRKIENIYSTLILSSRMVYNRAKHLSSIYINGVKFNLDINNNFEVFEANIVREKIEQVWIIILNNACDEFEKSKIDFDDRKIDIVIRKLEDDKTLIKFKDNAGNGIPESILPNIFEPFQSGKAGSGVGIGLNIAKEIIETHSGTIKAYNEDNQAVFEVIL